MFIGQYTKRAELHCHSLGPKLSYFPWFYDAPQTVEQIIERCIEMGIHILSVTDHDSLQGSKRAEEHVKKHKLPILTVTGEEVTSREGHILAYGIEEDIPPGLSAQETVDRIKAQGGVAVAAHPFNAVMSLRNRIYKIKNLDAMEVLSPLLPASINKAQEMAHKKLGLPGVAGSDAHEVLGIGLASTWFKENVKTQADFLEAVKSGDFKIEGNLYSGIAMIKRQIRDNLRIKNKTVPMSLR